MDDKNCRGEFCEQHFFLVGAIIRAAFTLEQVAFIPDGSTRRVDWKSWRRHKAEVTLLWGEGEQFLFAYGRKRGETSCSSWDGRQRSAMDGAQRLS